MFNQFDIFNIIITFLQIKYQQIFVILVAKEIHFEGFFVVVTISRKVFSTFLSELLIKYEQARFLCDF